MSRYLNTRGNAHVAIAICGRCSTKVSYDDLGPDPNNRGLLVCDGCRDVFDPYRLPPRRTENISLTHPRPDTPLVTE